MTEEPGGESPSKININSQAELTRWANELGVTEDQLRGAVTSVGDTPDAVRKFLQQSATPRQEMSE